MTKPFRLPPRQIHLDFHTSPAISGIGADFDARDFARTMKRAHVSSVTVFAKCHHGHLYYNTKRPERHPGLKPNFDLLGKQVEALHREGIRAPIYVSIQCDEFAANTHPEWIARQPDSRMVGPGMFQNSLFKWQILDMNSAYQDYLAEQLAEILRLFKPVDGLFFDMCWDQPSSSHAAIAAMQARGLDPENVQQSREHAHHVALAYMKRFFKQVKATTSSASVYFNSRPLTNLREELPYLEQVEIEALPSGMWGYNYFPTNVRFARTFGKQYMGMTGRFHRDWGDFGGLKPYPAMEYETSQMVANGAAVSVGDQLHPRGVLDPAVYDVIGRSFARLVEREPWIDGARSLAEIAVLRATPGVDATYKPSGIEDGAMRMLTQLRHQFDIREEKDDFAGYRVLVLPDAHAVDDALAKRLRRFMADGGKILATGTSGLSDDATRCVLPELGIKPAGLSPFTSVTYLRMARELLGKDAINTDTAIYERGVRVRPTGKARSLATVVEPYFERSWQKFSSHRQTPPERASRWSAAVLSRHAAYVSYLAFSTYAGHSIPALRTLVGGMLERLLPDQLLRASGPSGLETTVTIQGSGRSARTIVHLLYYVPERRAKDLDLVEDIVPLRDILISLRLAKSPKRCYLAPGNRALPFNYRDGRVELVVPEIAGHAMVVVE